ncbi:uncharacterized protein LOC107785243 isoform X5 [Nicotiana tabacum]|uniref:Uncharacterized protein LOC107785243 isoform X5 n=1 Tax=Nicotiana tabacum TaxID=4097 RepID=A0AC58UF87_TOBAC|nr:uncharacterized protein LOC104105137 isoform X5 [Nicotiana tomentosiformis]
MPLWSPLGVPATSVNQGKNAAKPLSSLDGLPVRSSCQTCRMSSCYVVAGTKLLYAICTWINGFACILELLAAPFYILSQNLLLLKSRLIVETAATLSHCLTIYFLFVKLPDMVFGFICQRYFISTSFHLKELVSKALPVC